MSVIILSENIYFEQFSFDGRNLLLTIRSWASKTGQNTSFGLVWGLTADFHAHNVCPKSIYSIQYTTVIDMATTAMCR